MGYYVVMLQNMSIDTVWIQIVRKSFWHISKIDEKYLLYSVEKPFEIAF